MVALLERLQKQVALLTTASKEGLLAVSIDALETDLKNGGTYPGVTGSIHCGFFHILITVSLYGVCCKPSLRLRRKLSYMPYSV